VVVLRETTVLPSRDWEHGRGVLEGPPRKIRTDHVQRDVNDQIHHRASRGSADIELLSPAACRAKEEVHAVFVEAP